MDFTSGNPINAAPRFKTSAVASANELMDVLANVLTDLVIRSRLLSPSAEVRSTVVPYLFITSSLLPKDSTTSDEAITTSESHDRNAE